MNKSCLNSSLLYFSFFFKSSQNRIKDNHLKFSSKISLRITIAKLYLRLYPNFVIFRKLDPFCKLFAIVMSLLHAKIGDQMPTNKNSKVQVKK